MPLAGFLYLLKNRKVIHEEPYFSKYKMIYQGLKPWFFFWEFVNLLRKVFLVSVNVFLSMFPNIFKALLSLLVLIVFLRI